MSKLSDKMSCYCSLLYSETQDDFKMDDSFENGEQYCKKWYMDYIYQSIGAILIIPSVISVINVGTKIMLQKAISKCGYHSRPQEMYILMQSMYFLAFVNSAIIIQLVYMDLTG